MLSPRLLVDLATFLFGLLFGSFLNVCISRLTAVPRESIVAPRSHCRSCAAPLRWHDNIPVISWLLLRARCRHCGMPISARYPLVELSLAVWWTIAADRLLPIFLVASPVPLPLDSVLAAIVRTAAFAAFGFFAIGLVVTDWEAQLLPDLLTIPGIITGLFFVSLQAMLLHTGEGNIVLSHRQHLNSPAASMARGNIFLTGTEALVFGRIGSVLLAAGLLLVLRWTYRAVRHREGLGLGDVKLLGMIAAFLGLAPTLLALFVGVTAAAAWAVVLLAGGRAGRHTRLPLGSFLSAGALLSALYGEPILRWYRSLL